MTGGVGVRASRALTLPRFARAPPSPPGGELRELLAAWRDAKRSVWKAVAGWIARLFVAVVLAGLAVKLGFAAWLK